MTLRAPLVIALALLTTACGSDGDGGVVTTPSEQGYVDLALNLVVTAPVHDAIWDVALAGPNPDLDWSGRLTSADYGDGQGSLSYVLGCAAGRNTVRVSHLGLYAAAVGDAAGAQPGDPYPSGSPAILGEPAAEVAFDCVADEDRFLGFGFVPGLASQTLDGPPAIRVGASVCAVRWICDDGPALDVSCLGPGSAPVVLMDDLVVHCDDGGEDVVIDPTTAGPPEEVLNQTLWRVPVAVDAERAAAATCTVTTRLTPGVPAGEEGRFGVRIADRAIVAPTVYPLVTLSAVVADHGPSCQAELVGDPDSGALRVVYTAAGAAADTVLDHASR
ncbi:MAG: hypothetical protein KC635_29190 [Myxococcales bacterium]|nr:hypothetical protein [Myxococcales bacterium]